MLILYALYIAYFFIAVAICFCFIRLIKGPKMVDRILAIDTMYVNVVVMLVLQSIHMRSLIYFVSALLISCLGFAGTLALCKFLLRGNVME